MSSDPAKPSIREALFNRRMVICVFTGFSSGMPLYLLFNLLPAWLRTEGIGLKEIGLFALIQFPYTWKFLWAPVLDRFGLPLLGRRRGWMLITQLGLLAVIAALGFLSPKDELDGVVALTVALALLSATQDIVLDAYRRELLPDQELGLGNAFHVNAYKVSTLVPGSLALILADHLPWSAVFSITALFMLPGVALTLMVRELALSSTAPKTLRAAVVEPFREFFGRNGVREALVILAFVLLYKLGDSMCTALATPFYLDMGYSKSDIGIVAKNAGLWANVAGGFVGGLWMVRLGINRALWIFGVVQGIAIIGFAWLAWQGQQPAIEADDLARLAFVIALEALGVGLGTAAFVAFIAKATNPLYTATQFALLTSLMAVPRTFLSASTGFIVEGLGWFNFFVLCTLLAVPGMLLLFKVAPWNERPAQAG
ncbi:MAG: AmpG family muropeptide MFS transporter [Deltaproteobacteria bacterium RBG_16_71_12]|nr:MAG: AmpG family muropeptide MFS transporter [Deltaproteobacteria bacterium RBG_16_71_12]